MEQGLSPADCVRSAACLPLALPRSQLGPDGLSLPAGAGGVATYQGAARRLAHLTPQQLFAPCGVGAFCLTCGFRLLLLH